MVRHDSPAFVNDSPCMACYTQRMTHNDKLRGFSLVELSIVLVILGLLTGGILAGQSLIRAAEIRKFTGEMSKFQSSYHAFRDKYFAMPGDFNLATSFWPTPDCASGGACNGGGDNIITTAGESRFVWQHLELAGLWPGHYYGRYRTTGLVNGYDVPISPLGSSQSIDFVRKILGSGSSTHNFVPTGHYIYHGTIPDDGAGSGYLMDTGTLNGDEVWRIDTKMDDGMPRSGKIWGTSYCGLATGYNLTSTLNRCVFWTHIAD